MDLLGYDTEAHYYAEQSALALGKPARPRPISAMLSRSSIRHFLAIARAGSRGSRCLGELDGACRTANEVGGLL